MELVKPIMSIYYMYHDMKNLKEQYPHLASRLEAINSLVTIIQEKQLDKHSEDIHLALTTLSEILKSGEDFIQKIQGKNVAMRAVNLGDYTAELDSLNKHLTDAFVTLSGALHVYQQEKLEVQQVKLEDQEVNLEVQRMKLEVQQEKLQEQQVKLEVQQVKLEVQQIKLDMQQMKLERQDQKLEEQEDILLRVESTLYEKSTAFYCVVQ